MKIKLKVRKDIKDRKDRDTSTYKDISTYKEISDRDTSTQYKDTSTQYKDISSDTRNIPLLYSTTKSLMASFKSLKLNCENRNSDDFAHSAVSAILYHTNVLCVYTSAIGDVPVTYYRRVMECSDYVGLYREIKREMETEERMVEEKKQRYKEYQSKI